MLLKLYLSPTINFVIEGSLEARYWVILNNLHKLEISAGLKEAPVDHDGRQKFLHLARASLEESERWWRRRCHLRLFLEKDSSRAAIAFTRYEATRLSAALSMQIAPLIISGTM